MKTSQSNIQSMFSVGYTIQIQHSTNWNYKTHNKNVKTIIILIIYLFDNKNKQYNKVTRPDTQ